MRITIYTLIIWIACFAGQKPTGIQLHKGSWGAVTKLSKMYHKPIMVFASTKEELEGMRIGMMLKDKKAGEYYNSRFICTSMDAGKFQNHMRLKHWNIRNYPAIIFLDDHQNVITKAFGFLEPEKLVNEGKTVITFLKMRQSNNKNHPVALW